MPYLWTWYKNIEKLVSFVNKIVTITLVSNAKSRLNKNGKDFSNK